MNALVFRSLQSFTLICFDRDKNSQVTISSVTDRSDSVNSNFRCVSTSGTQKVIVSQLAAVGLEGQVESILISWVEGIMA